MIEVLHPGIQSSIQDLGRLGHQSFGVPIGGAMDQNAFNLSNRLLNNPSHSAALEMGFKGPKLLFHQSTTVALTGADMGAKLNGQKISNFSPVEINEKDLLEFGNAHCGKRTYMAVAGGIQTPEILNSRSQYKGITSESKLSKTKLIPFNMVKFDPPKGVRISPRIKESKQMVILVYKGPDFNLLSENAKNKLCQNTFSISNKNSRMAYILEEKLVPRISSIWTSPVLPGTVQCTPNGTLIILMRDAQTTGGYPRILQVTDEGLNILAQKSTKECFQFQLSSV
jgi:biotin-dependent carboxylase-like uncharacterized protein